MTGTTPVRARRRLTATLALALGGLLSVVATQSQAMTIAGAGLGFTRATERIGPPLALTPPAGTRYLAVQLDWAKDSPSTYIARSGLRPSVYGDFAAAPFTAAQLTLLRAHARATALAHASYLLTVEPNRGLSSMTTAAVKQLATLCATINATGTVVYLRFAHEMNGSWHAWGQQPAQYIATFRKVAAAVHAQASKTQMVWAPNYGGGYPFSGGRYSASKGTSAFSAMDTNHDGVLNLSDDPYAPFYPGDASVDWIDLTTYYLGHAWPWGENEVPSSGQFVAEVSGTFHTVWSDEQALPNFYQEMVAAHRKPMMLAETSALYNPNNKSGATHLAISSAWMSQVLSSTTRTAFPRLAMVGWFEFDKRDQGLLRVDWRATADPLILKAYRAQVAAGHLVQAH